MQRGAPLREVRLFFSGGHALPLLGEDISDIEEALPVQTGGAFPKVTSPQKKGGALNGCTNAADA